MIPTPNPQWIATPKPQWDDGVWGVYEAGQIPAGVNRSKTRKTLKEAVAVDPKDCNMTTPVGPGNKTNLSKTRMADMEAAYKKLNERLANAKGVKISMSGPDPMTHFPHECKGCGTGRFYQGAGIHYEHWPEPECPGKKAKKLKERWV